MLLLQHDLILLSVIQTINKHSELLLLNITEMIRIPHIFKTIITKKPKIASSLSPAFFTTASPPTSPSFRQVPNHSVFLSSSTVHLGLTFLALRALDSLISSLQARLHSRELKPNAKVVPIPIDHYINVEAINCLTQTEVGTYES
ncbi:hypothetical protein YC2023_082770 [Brassica napus]